jgi:hypothetical protein
MGDGRRLLGTKNGREFTSDAFATLIREHGLGVWGTAPHGPEQTGKMKRFWAMQRRAH